MYPGGRSTEQTVAFLKGLTAIEPDQMAGCLAATGIGAEQIEWLRLQRLAPLPEPAQAALQSAFCDAVTLHTLLSAELSALLAECRKRGIEPAVLRGMALAATAYTHHLHMWRAGAGGSPKEGGR